MATYSITGNTASPRVDWPTVTFFALAYVIGWTPVPVLAWLASDAGLESWRSLNAMAESGALEGLTLAIPNWSIYLLTRIQDFAFSISGIVLISFLHGTVGLRNLGSRLLIWRFSPWCWLIACLPAVFYTLATFTATAQYSFTFTASTVSAALFSLQAGLLVTLFLRGPMGEELGLRGFVLPRLQSSMSPFKASIIIGLLWAAWHLPVLIDRDPVSIVLFLLLAFLLSFVFTWLFNSSKGSLIPGLIFHTLQNNEELFELLFPALNNTNWELISSICILMLGIIAGVKLWRTRDTI